MHNIEKIKVDFEDGIQTLLWVALFRRTEVEARMRKLKNGKSASEDKASGEMVKIWGG